MNRPARPSLPASTGQPMRTIRKRLRPALARHRATSQGFLMPLGLIAMLAMIGGVMMEISRLNYALVASIRTSEARKAMDAAEFGLGAILDDLNTNSNSYLLATKFTNPNGTGTWQSVTGAQLTACGLLEPTPAPSANRIAGVSTNSSGSSVALPSDQNVTYSMVSYEPPPSVTTPSSGCDMFGNLSGGRARITVRGIVRRGGVEKARFDVDRVITIATSSRPDPNAIGLLITGPASESKLGKPFYIVYDENNDAQVPWSKGKPSEIGANVNCIQCVTDADLETKGTSFGNLINGPLPGLPPFPSIPPELAGVAPKDLGSSYSNYPFTTASPTPGDPLALVSECSWLTVNGVANAEIGCRLGDVNVGGSKKIVVRADVRPLNWFVSGSFIVSGSGEFTISDGDSGTPVISDLAQYWRNLRIYGKPGTPASDGKNCDQQITLSGGGEATGAFMWFPLGKAKISGGNAGKTTPDFYGALWTCIFNSGSGNSNFLVPQDVVQTFAPGITGSGAYLYRAYGAN